MCFSCKKYKIWSNWSNRYTNQPISFSQKQRDELKKKFQNLAGNRQVITKEMFRQNIGVLGLRVSLRSDRLFNSFDLDDDGQINFADFVEYMDIIKNGKQKQKAYISFRMIKTDKTKKYFNRKDFQQFMNDFLYTWSTLTNHQISPQILNRNKEYIQNIFQKVKQKQNNNKQIVDFDYYNQYIYKDQEFVSAFDFITQGVADLFVNKPTQKQMTLQKKFIEIQQTLTQIYSTLYSDSQTIQIDDIAEEMKPNDIPIFKRFNFPISFFAPKKYEEADSLKSTQVNFKLKTEVSFQSKLQNVKNKFFNLLKDVRDVKKKIQQQNQQQKIPDLIKQKRTNTVANVHKKIKEGQMIYIGDDNWNLVLNMMIGIQMAVMTVNSYQNQEMIYEQPMDFKLKYYFQLIPRRFGGDKKNLSTICKFTDYAPNTFNHIRRLFGINNDDYIKSIGTQKLLASLLLMGQISSLSELTSQGKSGSFFYYTADGQYMLKTIHHREYKFLLQILQDYYYYLKKNKESLITKFFGLHKLVQRSETGNTLKKHYFVIMANVFNTTEKIIQRFDIKGSTYGRQNLDNDQKATKKDNDFLKRQKIQIQNTQKQQLLDIIIKDAQFFAEHQIIDYSLLIGVIKKKGQLNQSNTNQYRSMISEQLSMIHPNQSLMAKVYETTSSNGNKQKYVFGIIDILTLYDTRKKMQYCFKRTIYGNGISAIPPSQYAERFYQFINEKVFK